MVGHRTSSGLSGVAGRVVPVVSVIMANFESGRCIAQALGSVSAQTLKNIEIIVSDDASRDDSLARVRAAMAQDPRIVLLEAEENSGPAKARNRALAQARGEWIAIVDADDLIHPERLERMLAVATHEGAAIVADDLLHFHDDGSPSRYLLPGEADAVRSVSPEEWIVSGSNGTPSLGYLKPLIRADVLGDMRYDETLRIGEDYDLILRLLLKGAVLKLVPEPWYLYRRHSRSLSYRVRAVDVASMIGSHRQLAAGAAHLSPSVQAALARRLDGLVQAHDFGLLVEAIKRGDMVQALAGVARRPWLLVRLAQAVAERWDRRTHAVPVIAEAVQPPRLVVLAAVGSEAGDERTSEVLEVPAYRPVNGSPPGSEGRDVWRAIADLAARRTRFLPEGQAGVYAAGFIPQWPDMVAMGGPTAKPLAEMLETS